MYSVCLGLLILWFDCCYPFRSALWGALSEYVLSINTDERLIITIVGDCHVIKIRRRAGTRYLYDELFLFHVFLPNFLLVKRYSLGLSAAPVFTSDSAKVKA